MVRLTSLIYHYCKKERCDQVCLGNECGLQDQNDKASKIVKSTEILMGYLPS